MTDEIELPPLPECRVPDRHGIGWFTAGQMRDFAIAAIKADREKRGAAPQVQQEPVAWLITIRDKNKGWSEFACLDYSPPHDVEVLTKHPLYAAPQVQQDERAALRAAKKYADDNYSMLESYWNTAHNGFLEGYRAAAPQVQQEHSLAELGRIALRFVDRAGDVAECDPAEKICAEFYKAMSDEIERAAAPPAARLTD